VTPDVKLFFFVAEFRNNTGLTTWEDGSGEETTAEKRSSLLEAMIKKRSSDFFKKK